MAGNGDMAAPAHKLADMSTAIRQLTADIISLSEAVDELFTLMDPRLVEARRVLSSRRRRRKLDVTLNTPGSRRRERASRSANTA